MFFKTAFENKSSKLRKSIEGLELEKKRLVEMVKKGADYDDVKDDLNETKSKIRRYKLELGESHQEEFKIELLLDYADNFLRNLPKFWFDLDTSNKIKLQRVLFPEGLVYSYPGFSNTKLSPLFKLYATPIPSDSTVVNQLSLEWNTFLENLIRQYGILKRFIQLPPAEPAYLKIAS